MPFWQKEHECMEEHDQEQQHKYTTITDREEHPSRSVFPHVYHDDGNGVNQHGVPQTTVHQTGRCHL